MNKIIKNLNDKISFENDKDFLKIISSIAERRYIKGRELMFLQASLRTGWPAWIEELTGVDEDPINTVNKSRNNFVICTFSGSSDLLLIL